VVALRRARSEEELAIYAVALSYDSRGGVERFARDQGLNVPVLLGTEQMLRDYNISAFPTIYVIGADGKVRARTVGYTTEVGLRLRSM